MKEPLPAAPPLPLRAWSRGALLRALGLPERGGDAALAAADGGRDDLPGWRPADRARLAAALELGRRALALEPSRGARLGGGADVHAFLAPHLHGLQVECFHALYLDAKGGLLEWRRISEGTLTASLVHPREVYGPALALRAAALVVAHNHPSGDPEPSAEDRATTRRLQRAGRLLGIELLDHVVVAGPRYCSFLDKGWM